MLDSSWIRAAAPSRSPPQPASWTGRGSIGQRHRAAGMTCIDIPKTQSAMQAAPKAAISLPQPLPVLPALLLHGAVVPGARLDHRRRGSPLGTKLHFGVALGIERRRGKGGEWGTRIRLSLSSRFLLCPTTCNGTPAPTHTHASPSCRLILVCRDRTATHTPGVRSSRDLGAPRSPSHGFGPLSPSVCVYVSVAILVGSGKRLVHFQRTPIHP